MELTNKVIPEKVKVKISKLKELSEREDGGEALNAQRVLDELCLKYGISKEELYEDPMETYKFEVRKSSLKIFLQVLVSKIGTTKRYIEDCHIYGYSGKSAKVVEVKLTISEYIEISQLWEWHRKNFYEERRRFQKLFGSAYIEKFGLYPCETDETFEEYMKNSQPKKEEDFNDMMAIASMSNAIKDKQFHKQLEK